MTRVSENSSSAALKYALNRTKAKVEDLQLKGSQLKSITKPSDNPVSNVEALALTSAKNDNLQYLKNADFALLNLSVTEKSIEELTDIVMKAKEIAIAQSSDFFNSDIRKNIANEVDQLFNQALAISNKKVGLKHIFSGTNTLTTPFDSEGNYKGNEGKISLEVSRNFFVPINLTGAEVFSNLDSPVKADNPLEGLRLNDEDKALESEEPSISIKRDLASAEEGPSEDGFVSRDSIFSQLRSLSAALENNDPKMVQSLLDKFDNSMSRLVTLRTRIGSIINSIDVSKSNLEAENIDHASRKSALVDADVAELFSDINKQQSILKTTYQSTQGIMSQTLMDFLRR